MRRLLAAVVVTAVALLGPASVAQADPPHRVEVDVLWPLCVTVLGTTICIPP